MSAIAMIISCYNKPIVVKVGTNILSKGSQVDTALMAVIARQIAELVRHGRRVILVTSGAIGMGAGALGMKQRPKEVDKQQACAAIGQGILMGQYQRAFGRYGQKVAQILLTNRIMSQRRYYLNLKNTVETLLAMGVVPIVNENDSVSIDEIGLAFGDNDVLSALVASKIDAELLIILTDVDGLYERNPHSDKKAKLIPVVYSITKEIESIAGKAGSKFGRGGMASKIKAIKIAADSGCKVVLANGRENNVIGRIVTGEKTGTLFLPKRRLSNRKRWILNCHTEATIAVDPGAKEALANRRSLLAVGVVSIAGTFDAGEVVQIGDFAKGLCDVSSTQLRQLLDRQQNAGAKAAPRKAIVHADNLVLLDG